MTFEISGWQADWQPAREQLVRHTDRFRGLGGKQVKRGWVAWIEEHEERFPDLPVIVEFEDGVRLEVCWQKFDDLSITWNSIDVTVPPMAWVTWPLSWRLAGHPALTKVAGAVVTQVNATEHLFTTRTVCPEESAGTEPAVWL